MARQPKVRGRCEVVVGVDRRDHDLVWKRSFGEKMLGEENAEDERGFRAHGYVFCREVGWLLGYWDVAVGDGREETEDVPQVAVEPWAEK